MKWTRELEPADGGTRLRKKFLLWPKTIRFERSNQKQTRWLETATWLEQYDKGWDYGLWIEKHWSD